MRHALLAAAVVAAGLTVGCRPKPNPKPGDSEPAPAAVGGGPKGGAGDGSSRPRVARKLTAAPAGWQAVLDPQNEFGCWLPEGKVATDLARDRPFSGGQRVDLRTLLSSNPNKFYIATAYVFHGADPDAPSTRADLDRDCDNYLQADADLLKVQVTADARTPMTVGGVAGLKAVVRKSRGPGEVIYLARSAGRLFRFHQSLANPADADGPDAAAFARGIEILIR